MIGGEIFQDHASQNGLVHKDRIFADLEKWKKVWVLKGALKSIQPMAQQLIRRPSCQHASIEVRSHQFSVAGLHGEDVILRDITMLVDFLPKGIRCLGVARTDILVVDRPESELTACR